jgi:hypothetical protein
MHGANPARALGPALLLCAAAACGGEPAPEPVQETTTSGAEQPESQGRGMQVSGLMGTIPERKIQGALEPRLPRFQQCFARGAGEVEFIAGAIEFYFRVGLDGRVEWVYPRASSIGHRATERCLLELAAATRFPEPKGGGAAEFAWGFEIDGPDGVRPPVAWDAPQVVPALEGAADALAACALGDQRFEVTAYVLPGGKVLAAGAAAPGNAAAAQIDCLVDAIQSVAMPDPGSYPAKVTFELP